MEGLHRAERRVARRRAEKLEADPEAAAVMGARAAAAGQRFDWKQALTNTSTSTGGQSSSRAPRDQDRRGMTFVVGAARRTSGLLVLVLCSAWSARSDQATDAISGSSRPAASASPL